MRMNTDNRVSKKVFILSIILGIISVGVGVYALVKEEYIIAVAMLFVLTLQAHNIFLYKQQHG